MDLDIEIFPLLSMEENHHFNGRYKIFWLKDVDERGSGMRKLSQGRHWRL